MHVVIHFVIVYVQFLKHFAPIIVPAAIVYLAYNFRKENKRRASRHEAVEAFARQYGLSYAESDLLIRTDPIK